MENKIKVGEYVRTRKGIIGILKQQFTFGHGVNYPEPQEWVININGKEYVITECDVDFDNIVKHSFNLKDIIQKDDFVNGDRVVAIDYTEDENGNYVDVLGIMEIDGDYAYQIELRVINIQEVVTKEMMESITYKVK